MDGRMYCMPQSNAVREWVRRARADEHMDLRELDSIADRIDAEMVELPRDRDGVPIHVDDTVYLEGGRKATVTRIELIQGEHGIDFSVCGNFFALGPEDFTHVPQDSFERIADDIEESKGTVFIESSTLGEWADRIRKLAAKEDK